MPLALRSPFSLLRRSKGREDTRDRSKSRGATNKEATRENSNTQDIFERAPSGEASNGRSKSARSWRGKSREPETPSGTNSRSSTSSTSMAEPINGNAKAFRVQVPAGAKPGDSIRFKAPDGRLVEIDLPDGCIPGQKVTIEIDGSDDWRRTLKDMASSVMTSFEATQASCRLSKEKLREELELQKGLWASASTTQQSMLFNMRQENRPQDLSLAMTGGSCDELSQTQVLVFAAAEAGDGKQLLAALAEARKFSTVSLSLEECVQTLNAAEEAMITWRCLLDSLQAENRHEIEVWVEEARSLGFQAPAGLPALLEELQRREEASLKHYSKCKEVEDKVKFAMEANDPDLLAEVVAEASSIGLQGPVMQQASHRVRAQQMHRMRMTGSSGATSSSNLGSSTEKPRTSSASSATPAGGQWHPKPRSPRGRESAKEQPHRREESSPPLFPKVGEERSARSPGAASSTAGGPEAGAGPTPMERTQAPYGNARKAPDDGRSVKDLIEECRRLGIETTGCTDADDLRRLILNSPKPKAPPTPEPSAPQGFIKRVPASQAQQADSSTVWGRLNPPAQFYSKKQKALYLLGLDPVYTNPPPAQLRSAYKKAAMECHPDRAQNHSRQDQAKDLFQKVKEAFDELNAKR